MRNALVLRKTVREDLTSDLDLLAFVGWDSSLE